MTTPHPPGSAMKNVIEQAVRDQVRKQKIMKYAEAERIKQTMDSQLDITTPDRATHFPESHPDLVKRRRGYGDRMVREYQTL
jgi:hypothetical protein